MARTKYFAGVRAAQKAAPFRFAGPVAPFDLAAIDAPGRLAKAASRLIMNALPTVYSLARRWRPLLRLGGMVHVTRAEQVRDVLLRTGDFKVPFGAEMADLGEGAIFMLGLDGQDHARLRRIMSAAIVPADVDAFVRMSGEFSEALLENAAGRIDVIGDLLKRVPAEVALRWYGLEVEDVDLFGDWTLAVSALLFGDPPGKPVVRQTALSAARHLRITIDEAILRTRRHLREGHLAAGAPATVIERLVLGQPECGLTDAELGAMIMGMVTGFVPTNTLAAARALEVILDRDNAAAMAREAARTEDRAAMKHIVLEAARLSPALYPGQLRYCPRETTLEIDGREHRIAAGSTLMVSTMSAMRDARAVSDPLRFDPDRKGPDGKWQEPEFVFGFGPHDCIGKHLAIEQITSVFMALFARPQLARAGGKAGKMQWLGAFPRRLELTFATPAACQTMFLVIAPLAFAADKDRVDAELARLGHPAGPEMRTALDASGVVHFSSLATLETENGVDLVWELSVDGTAEDALVRILPNVEPLVRQAFSYCGAEASADLAGFVRRHIVGLHGKPWGATGLDYNGLGEFPVATVARQEQLARFCERALGDFLSSEAQRGSHPMLALDHVRRLLRQDHLLERKGTDAQRSLIAEAREQRLDALAMRPENARLNMTAFRALSGWAGLGKLLCSRDSLVIWTPFALMLAGFALLFWNLRVPSPSVMLDAWHIGLRALLAALVLGIGALALFFLAIRRAEKRDHIDASQAPIDHIAALNAQDDAPGYAQNHVMAVGTLKPGLLRTLSYTFALWFVKVLITYNYRPGFILSMGTIHYARWWRRPGTRTVAFYSNFDGSWESYLEDFIMRAHIGQTAVWSNWQGFPPSKFLLLSGAKDGDRFKRWVRIRQRLAPFWYSRFPHMTSDTIRNNALIHAGLSRARSQDEAEEWLRCFGSMPRMENRIEGDEVQALVFNGMGRLKHSASLVVQLPEAGEKLGEWLSWLRGEAQSLDLPDHTGLTEQRRALVDSGVLAPVYAAGGKVRGYALAHSLTVTFGDRPLVGKDNEYEPADAAAQAGETRTMRRRAVFLGISAAGLARFDAPNSGYGRLSEAFPPAFRMGMAARERNLGDFGAGAPANWRWGDGGKAQQTGEAAMLVYAETPDDLAFMADVHQQLLENHGGKVLHRLDCAPARIDGPEDEHDFEHFGYRDGIAQPVIKGTSCASRPVPERDLVEPGEFIVGYAANQGYFPNTALLPPEADPGRTLPHLAARDLNRFPDFDGLDRSRSQRDLGRNGTFLVLRELKQDVAGFESFVEAKAAELRHSWRDLYKVIGQHPDKDWIKAKLMGRWPSGRPLIGNPVHVPMAAPGDPDAAECRAAERENDFTYGVDDPQGLACPFASHIRRTNPRDSKQPRDPLELAISNRHRLLRRGRAYVRRDAEGQPVEKGLLFASLCTDLERQFEFVQQFWSNAPGFHGLSNEPDPIIGGDLPDPRTGCPAERSFSIPTPAGTIRLTGMQSFVQTMAGGYFFMPSRSALRFLTDISLRKGDAQ